MSFDPQNFEAPSEEYGSYGSDSRGQSRVRPVPLVLTIVFALVAVVSVLMNFAMGGGSLTTDQQNEQSILLLVGAAAFVGLIVSGRKLVRKR